MDIRKYEQLINLVINEDEEQARELFHEIVVEKSREIFESIMTEEDDEEDLDESQMVGEVGDLMDEIGSEEADEGMYEEEEDDDFPVGDDDEEDIELTGDEPDFDAEDGEEEETLIRIEDKLDQLMAEFEEIMGGDVGDEEDFGDEDEEGEFASDDNFGGNDFGGEDYEGEEGPEEMMENINLKQVPGLYGSKIGGDDGQYTKSPNTNNSGQAGMDSKPVNFAGGGTESMPTSPKGPSNFYSKGETSVKHANDWKNTPAKDNFKEKGEAAPKPKKGDDGSNSQSVVAESRRRRIKR